MATIQNLRDRYVGDSIATASPARLLTMLFDRLCLDLEIADAALQDRDYATASQRLVHAQDIITELQTSLDPGAWSGAAGLSSLYRYLQERLVAANIAKDAAIVDECLRLIEPLRGAWHEASRAQVAHPTAHSA